MRFFNASARSNHSFAAFACFVCCFFFAGPLLAQDRMPLILDADTGNEVDDLFAVARALIEPTWEVTALNATQWQTSHWAEPQSMENSHRLNQVLVGYLDVPVKLRRGGVARMYDWGDQAQHSAAAYEIIKQASDMPAGEKLTVVALGALTNVASAVYIEPEISSKIRLFWLGSVYDFEEGLMSTTDFNCVMDVQALDVMLKSDVEMHVMPINVALEMEFTYQETEDALKGKHGLGDYLVDRWYQHLDGSRKSRYIWDLGLIGAMIHPEWAETVEITTSRERGSRPITYYKSLEGEKVKAEFFETVNAYFDR